MTMTLVTRLEDVVDVDLLDYHLVQGNIKRTAHPSLPLDIYNYTPKVQYSREWDDTTKACRGLIVHQRTYEVISRPFPKFFNWGEVENDKTFKHSGSIKSTDKLDGSLGILYRYVGRNYIATRGSFTSEQALKATEILRAKYPEFVPYEDCTYLFEIIYPENRIVLDYGDKEDLYLLDILDTHHGYSLLHTNRTVEWFGGAGHWRGPVAKNLHQYSLTQALHAKPRDNAEGMVLYFQDWNTRVKIKQDEYVRLHRIITGVSTKSIWECLRNGEGIAPIIQNVPDEFFAWVEETIAKLHDHYNTVADAAHSDYVKVMTRLAHHDDERAKRKEFASLATKCLYPGLMFAYYDDRDVSEMVWKLVKPTYSKPFKAVSEDVA